MATGTASLVAIQIRLVADTPSSFSTNSFGKPKSCSAYAARLVIPPHFISVAGVYRAAFREQLAMPLQPKGAFEPISVPAGL
jgi:hypothetical protein